MDSTFVDLAKTVTLQGIEAIKNNAPVVYQAAYERAYAGAVMGIAVSIFLAGVSIIFLCVGLYGINKNEPENTITGFILCGAFLFISLIVLSINLATYYSLDYHAMENIRQLIVGPSTGK